MWVRNEAAPTEYRGIRFRSALEAKVAKELDGLGVAWHYEVRPSTALSWVSGSYEPDPPAQIDRYLPDFTVPTAEDYLQIPLWIEVKPAELLWAVRDHVGCQERFDGDFTSAIDAHAMYAANLQEIWKPKLLAEICGRDVLVVSAVNRNRLLSILMRPRHVVLSKRHPLVNHKTFIQEQERAEQEARRRAEREEWEARRKAEAVLAEQRLKEWLQQFRRNSRQAGYPGRCEVCRNSRLAPDLMMARGEDRWIVVCKSHLNDP